MRIQQRGKVVVAEPGCTRLYLALAWSAIVYLDCLCLPVSDHHRVLWNAQSYKWMRWDKVWMDGHLDARHKTTK